ncbi:PAAR domain-containing protein [Acinetobacter ihumii]|uniref:PAAR domain-containing protein n=1 Tax=Acinetobacter ihumii TaxID=2483802 RepID=UPI0010307163|nr:PAAR domain-containing protein [Acinetobacter ihumii]
MATPYIVIGCPTTGGGQVISGNSTFLVDGIAIACVGDKATCPKHKTVATIISGDPHMQVMGKAAARVNDSLSCGCKLLPKQNLVVQENGPSSGANPTKSDATSPQNSFVNQIDDYGVKFLLRDEQTGSPLIEQYFKLVTPDGKLLEGFTDETGHTEMVETGKEAKEVDLTTFDLSEPMKPWE